MTLLSRTWMSRQSRLLAYIAVVALVGCAATDKHEVLETRLRHQEDMLSSYQSQLDRTKTELDIARRESDSLRTQLAEGSGPARSRDQIDTGLRATNVEFSTFMTGGINIDGQPGDDGLAVVLVPQGPDGELVRASGTVEIEAFDLSHQEGAQRIGHWQFDARESHHHWHDGVIQSGYQFELPWQDIPQSETVLLHGRLVASDGRQFDTTHNIRIEPPDPALARGTSPANRSGRIQQTAAVTGSDHDGETGVKNAPAASTGKSAGLQVPFGHAGRSRSRTPSDAKAFTGREFMERLRGSKSLSVGGATPAPDNRTPASRKPKSLSSASGERNGTFDAQVPPPIQDAPDDADWSEDDGGAHQTNRPAIRTSDSWTDATLPYLR